MKTNVYTLPSIWASYLINGDPSGLESADIDQCDNETKNLGSCVSVSEETHFGQFKGIGHDLAEYNFVVDAMKTKHTPGPWKVNKKVKTSVETIKDGQGINLIAQTEDPDGKRLLSEDQANAKLIAAAPELLEALKHFVELYEQDKEMSYNDYCKAKTAIKATE